MYTVGDAYGGLRLLPHSNKEYTVYLSQSAVGHCCFSFNLQVAVVMISSYFFYFRNWWMR